MNTLTTWALVLGSVAGILTAVKVITGSGPARWLWRRLIIDPVHEALSSVVRAEIRPYLDELKPNGGSSMNDRLGRMEAEMMTLRQNLEEDRLHRDGRG